MLAPSERGYNEIEQHINEKGGEFSFVINKRRILCV